MRQDETHSKHSPQHKNDRARQPTSPVSNHLGKALFIISLSAVLQVPSRTRLRRLHRKLYDDL